MITVTRFLRNFEAPFVSLSTANQKYNENGHYHFLCLRYVDSDFIMIKNIYCYRKLIWDSRVEEPLLDDGNFVELLYKQAMQDYKNGHMDPVKEDLDSKLKSCMARNDSKMVSQLIFQTRFCLS